MEAQARKAEVRAGVLGPKAVESSLQLAKRLANYARLIKESVLEGLEREATPSNDKQTLHALFGLFNQSLKPLDPAQFGDAYAQTLSYGLFSARCFSCGTLASDFRRGNVHRLFPGATLFLRQLFDRLINADFDPAFTRLLDELFEFLAALDLDRVFQGERDPSLHFYQHFLEAYDPQARRKQGVYYTPPELVSFMVDRTDAELKGAFELPLGLADSASWNCIAKRRGIRVPAGVAGHEPFVQVLDPAAGTGTFLVCVVRRIHDTMMGEFQRQGLSRAGCQAAWNHYVTQQLLPRLWGVELMIAPFVVSHLRVALALQETGYRFQENDELQVFLENALLLGESMDAKGQAELSRLASKGRIRVILGNPPYNDSSQNLGASYGSLVEPFRYFQGSKIKEPGAIRFEHAINNDYIKFWGLGLKLFSDEDWAGVLCMVTPRSFLDSRSFRGVRDALAQRFSRIAVLDLHGDGWSGSARGKASVDENLFKIRTGIAVSLATRTVKGGEPAEIRYEELLGARQKKLDSLVRVEFGDGVNARLDPRRYYSFLPSQDGAQEYWKWLRLDEYFLDAVDGIKSSRDALVTGNSWEDCKSRVKAFAQAEPVESIFDLLRFSAGKLDLQKAQLHIRETFDPGKICELSYRPFDLRYLYYDRELILSHRMPAMQRILVPGAWALVCASRLSAPGFSHLLASNTLCANKYASHDVNSRMFPVLVSRDSIGGSRLCSNVRLERLGGLPSSKDPQAAANEFGCYLLGLLSSPSYATRYVDYVRQDFPRVPLPKAQRDYLALARFGEALKDAQTSEKLCPEPFELQGQLRGVLEKPSWKDGALRLNAFCSILGVSEKEWGFRCAGYQVIKSWASAGHRAGLARRGMPLSTELIAQYLGVIAGVRAQIEQAASIDRWIVARGGWSEIFETS